MNHVVNPYIGSHKTEETVCCSEDAKKICWGSILAGTVAALVVQTCFAILGIAIGASTIDPLVESNPLEGIGVGTAIWWIVTSMISLYIGGWVAGQGAGISVSSTHRGFCRGSLHGFVAWGVVTLVSFCLLTSALGTAVGGAAGALGKSLGFTAKAVGSTGGELKDFTKEFMKTQGIEIPNFDVSNLRREAEQVLNDTGKPELQPGQLREQGNQATNQVGEAANNIGNDPQKATEEFTMLFDRLYAHASGTVNASDKDALINFVATRKNISRENATQIVNNWEQAYNQAKVQFEEMMKNAQQKARQAADKVMEATSKGAFILFFVLLLGATAACIGGRCGSCCYRNSLGITK